MAIGLNTDGQPSSTIPDLLSSNTTLYPEYKCRAWVNFNGSTLTTYGSGNILSFTRNSTGDFTITFLNNMPDINYSIVMSSGNPGIFAMAINRVMSSGATQAPTISNFRVSIVDSGGTPINPTYVNIAVFR